MAQRPWSTRFVRSGPAGIKVSYSVPPGYRAVIKSVIFATTDGGGGVATAECAGALICIWTAPGPNTQLAASMSQVAYAGELISVFVSKSNMWASAAGYLLQDAAPGEGPQGDLSYERVLEAAPLPIGEVQGVAFVDDPAAA